MSLALPVIQTPTQVLLLAKQFRKCYVFGHYKSCLSPTPVTGQNFPLNLLALRWRTKMWKMCAFEAAIMHVCREVVTKKAKRIGGPSKTLRLFCGPFQCFDLTYTHALLPPQKGHIFYILVCSFLRQQVERNILASHWHMGSLSKVKIYQKNFFLDNDKI